ncbi:acetylornithine deacetylase/succinyl-diaminopimelate desuccinylase-like protein [Undibacterium sp. GrIS 1.8]|uniref:M20/M25/M40 family metallo-hydrolase n=1 Tax=Undibacterium sp. GrIS 1.8 TaxID=3143934 RepID=UPI00339462F9
MSTFTRLAVVFLTIAGMHCHNAVAQSLTPEQQLLRSIYQELIETNTTNSAGSCTVAAQAMSARLKAGGFADSDMQLIIPPGGPKKGMLVARLKGNGAKKPLLLLAHLDVIEAKREDWTRDPFKLIEEDGYFYARGTFDNKAQGAIYVANMIAFKNSGWKPARDLILAMTCDEETIPSEFDGVDYLLKHHRDLIEAELGLAEGGSLAQTPDGKLISHGLQAGEKIFQSYTLEVRNKGGHSSLPVPDNAIYHLAEGLTRLGKFSFPFRLTPTTRSFFERSADAVGGQIGTDMKAILLPTPDPQALSRLAQVNAFYNSSVRTTCVATMLNAGHATNALPQRAQAVVNCRILPGEKPEDVQQTLVKVLDDAQIELTPMGTAVVAPAPPLNPVLMAAMQSLSQKMWPGVPVIPTMAVGATDARFLNSAGIWTYGVSGLVKEANGSGIHGLNERLSVKSLYEGQRFLDELTRAMAK